jgi:hypothetical protein
MPPEYGTIVNPVQSDAAEPGGSIFVSLPESLYRCLKAEDDYLRFTSVSSSDLCPAERTPLRGDRLPGWRGNRSKSRAVSVTVSSCTDSCAESHMRLLSGCLAASPCQLTATLRRPSRAALVPQCHLGGTCMPGMAPARLSPPLTSPESGSPGTRWCGERRNRAPRTAIGVHPLPRRRHQARLLASKTAASPHGAPPRAPAPRQAATHTAHRPRFPSAIHLEAYSAGLTAPLAIR